MTTLQGAASGAEPGADAAPSEEEGSRPSIWGWFGRDRTRPDHTGTSTVPDSVGTRSLMLNIQTLVDRKLYDIAIPRADIVSVPDTAALSEVVEVFASSTYTRLPVFSETLDNPLGLIHLKDVALAYGFGRENGDFDLKSLIRPLLYAPPSMRVGVLLQKMQAARQHMALVIDEYGGVDGLVTMEDLVEQIVGEIADEHDAEEGKLWVEESPGVYLCQSRTPLQEFETAAGVDLVSDDVDEDIDTLGGLIFMLAGRVPVRGEVLRHPDGHEFEIVDADARRIKRMRVRIRRDTETALDKAAE